MPIRTVFTCVARFIRLLVASIVTLFNPVKSSKLNPSGDIETGMLAHHSDIEEQALPMLSDVIDIRRQSDPTPIVESRSGDDLPDQRPGRRVSVHPVKSRILDATLKNVRDRRFSVLKSVVVTSCSMTPIPCSVKVEFLPDSPAFGLSPLNSALKAFKSSKKRVVQFVLTPTFLPDIEIFSRASQSGSSSIGDLFDLFPPPPLHLPTQLVISSRHSVINPSMDNRLSGMVPTVPEILQCPKDHPLSFTPAERSLSSTTEASPSLDYVYTASSPATPGLVRTSSNIASVIEQEQVYSGEAETSILVDTPNSNTSNTSLVLGLHKNNHPTSKSSSSISCCGEVTNNAEVVPSSVPTHVVHGTSLSRALASSCVLSHRSPPVSTRSLSSNGTDPKETEIDVITLDDRNDPSTRSDVQLQAVNSGSYGDDVHHLSWRQSMEKILQAFRDTKTEDQDFRDLFSSALYRSIRSMSTMQRADNLLCACGTSCSSGMGHMDMSCSSLLVEEDPRDGDIATPDSVSENDMLLTPELGSTLEPAVELAQSPAGSFGGVLRSGLGITRLELVHLDPSKDTSSPRDLLLMLDRWVAIGDRNTKGANRFSSESDFFPSFPIGNEQGGLGYLSA